MNCSIIKEKETDNTVDRKTIIQYEVFALFLNAIMIVDLFRKILGSGMPVTIIRNVLYLGCFGYMLINAMMNKRLVFPLLFSLGYVALAVMGFLLHTELKSVILNGSLIFISRCVTGFYFAYYLRDYQLLTKALKKYYFVVLVYCAIYVYARLGSSGVSADYMSFSYNILFMTLLLLFWMFNKPSLWRIALSALLVTIIVVYGARGPVACILVSVFLYLIFKLFNSNLKQKIAGFAILGITGAVLITAQNWLVGLLSAVAPSSRTLRMLRNDRFVSLSGRNEYYSILLDKINENWLFPHGLYSDRLFLARGFDSNNYGSYYAHNFAFEVLVQFGGVLGSFILLVLLVLTFISLFRMYKARNVECAVYYCAFISGLTTLFFSSSYLINEHVWLFFGMAFAVIATTKKAKSSESDTQTIRTAVEYRNSQTMNL